MTTLKTVPSEARSTLDRPRRAVRARRPVALVLILLLPGLALYALFVIAPLLQAGFYSAFDWNGLGPLGDPIGFSNYERAWSDPQFHRALGNNISVIAVSLFVQLPLALGLALLLTGKFRGRGLFRVLFFIPYIMSEVVTGVLWKILLAPDGLVNQTLHTVGAGSLAQPWLGSTTTVMPALLWVVTWKFYGFYTLLFLAALQAVPHELNEAARVDGANRWQVFWNVTLPEIGPTVRISVFLAMIGSLQLFDLVWVMTQGGPAGMSTTMVTYMIRSGIQSYQYGYASAVAVSVALLSFVVAVTYQRFVLARDNRVETGGV